MFHRYVKGWNNKQVNLFKIFFYFIQQKGYGLVTVLQLFKIHKLWHYVTCKINLILQELHMWTKYRSYYFTWYWKFIT